MQDASPSLSLAQILSIIGKLNPNNCSRLHLLGGEPLSHPSIEIILKTLVAKGLPFSIVTNGLLVNHQLIDILKSKSGLEIVVSLDGANKTAHEVIRGTGTFGPAVRAIQKLVQELRGSGSLVSVSTTLHSQTVFCIPQLVNYAKQLDVDILYLNKLENYGRASRYFREIGVSPESLQRAAGKYFACHPAQLPGGRPLLVYSFLDTSLRAYLKNCRGIQMDVPYQPCRAATELGAIDQNGNLWPCTVFYANVELRSRLAEFFGLSDNSLVQNEFDEVWESRSFRYFRKQKLSNLHKTHGNPCKRCHYSDYCEPCFLPFLLGQSYDREDCLSRENWLSSFQGKDQV